MFSECKIDKIDKIHISSGVCFSLTRLCEKKKNTKIQFFKVFSVFPLIINYVVSSSTSSPRPLLHEFDMGGFFFQKKLLIMSGEVQMCVIVTRHQMKLA